VTVHSPVGQQTHEVHCATVGDCSVDRFSENGVLEYRVVLHGEIDAGELLIDDTPGSHVEMPDLGVAHLSLRQSDCEAGRLKRRTGPLSEQGIEVGSLSGGDCVAGTGRGDAVPVHDHENCGEVASHSAYSDAVRTIEKNDFASSAAPPTRAPSMSGSGMNSMMFSGLAEPP